MSYNNQQQGGYNQQQGGYQQQPAHGQPQYQQQQAYGQPQQHQGYQQPPPAYGQPPPQQYQHQHGGQPQYQQQQQRPQQQNPQWDPATKPNQQKPQQQQNAQGQGATVGSPLLGNEPQVGTPIYGDDCHPTLKQKFVSQGPKDVWAAVLFIAQLIFMIAFAIYNSQNDKINFRIAFLSSDDKEVHKAERYMGYAFGAAIFLCLIAMCLMRAHAKGYIWGANILCIVLWVAIVAYLFFVVKAGAWVLIYLIFPIIHAIWLYFARKRIPFAAVLLKNAVHVIQRNWGSIIVSFIQLAVLIVYFIGFLCMVIPTLNDLYSSDCKNDNDDSNDNDCGSSAKIYLIICGFLLMWFWSTQVFTNVVHVTASGSVATWYFAGWDNMPPTPSIASCKRAMTTSFGSICFGSLLVAILKLLHAIFRAMARRGGFLACIAACLIGCIERLMEYFNVYAFTHVAIYGMSYVEAGKATWEMIKQCLFAALFNDNLVYPVLNMTSLVNSIAIGVILGLAAWNVILGVICFLISFMVHILILRVVYSGIVTIFVCVAEAEDVLAVTNPEFHGQIQEAKAVMRESRC